MLQEVTAKDFKSEVLKSPLPVMVCFFLKLPYKDGLQDFMFREIEIHARAHEDQFKTVLVYINEKGSQALFDKYNCKPEPEQPYFVMMKKGQPVHYMSAAFSFHNSMDVPSAGMARYAHNFDEGIAQNKMRWIRNFTAAALAKPEDAFVDPATERRENAIKDRRGKAAMFELALGPEKAAEVREFSAKVDAAMVKDISKLQKIFREKRLVRGIHIIGALALSATAAYAFMHSRHKDEGRTPGPTSGLLIKKTPTP